MNIKTNLSELQAIIEGSYISNCENPEKIVIESVATLDDEKDKTLSFVRSYEFLKQAKESKVTALIITEKMEKDIKRPAIIVKDVEKALITVLEKFYPPVKSSGIVSKNVSIAENVSIGEKCEVGDFVSIKEGAVIGDNCIIGSNVTIGENVRIGDNSRIGPGNVIYDNVTIGKRFISFGNCTIGADGFRFIYTAEGHRKIPQVGRVVIGDDVEIGANCTIDRGGLDDTIIGDGCKFDNMVHIAHNCVLNKHIVIAGQSGIAGSTKVGNNVMISGHCAIQDHIELGDGVMIAGKTSVRKTIKESGVYAGEYALPLTSLNRLRGNIKELVKFNKWRKRVEKIEKKLGL